jgi:multiple sugar transport system substrate-binding protein
MSVINGGTVMNKRVLLTWTSILVISLSGCSLWKANSDEADSDIAVVSEVSGKVRVALAGWQVANGLDPVTVKKTTGFSEYSKKTFNHMYPNIELEVIQIPWENAQAKQKALLLSRDVDVLYTGGAFASQFYQQGLLRNIDDLIENDRRFDPDLYIRNVYENSFSTKSLDGQHQFGLPSVLGSYMIVYDKKLFDDWGVEYLSETPTPEEVLHKAKRMTGKNPVTGEKNYGLWFQGNSLNQYTFVTLTYAYGAEGAVGSLNDLKRVRWELNKPEMKKVFEWLKEESTLAPPAFINGQGKENFGLENNNIAIGILSASAFPAFSEYKSSGDTKLIERFVPVKNFGPDGKGWIPTDPIVMAKNADDVRASWEVMKFLASYDTQKHNYENFQYNPSIADPDFVDPHDVYTQKAIEIAKLAEPTLMDEANPFFGTKMVPVINGFISQAHNNRAPDIDELLKNLQQDATEWSRHQK